MYIYFFYYIQKIRTKEKYKYANKVTKTIYQIRF